MEASVLPWNPLLTYWTVQVAVQLLFFSCALWAPWVFLALLGATTLFWPISFYVGISLWEAPPLSMIWRDELDRWIVVCFCIVLPLSLAKMFPVKEWLMSMLGGCLHVVLASSIAIASTGCIDGTMPTVYAVVPVLLIVTLTVQVLAAMHRSDHLLERSDGGVCIYMPTTPLSWVVCFTSWSVVCCLRGEVGRSPLHILYIWGGMLLTSSAAGSDRSITLTFVFARAIALGGQCCGRIICGAAPYLKTLPHSIELGSREADGAAKSGGADGSGLRAGRYSLELFLVYGSVAGLLFLLVSSFLALSSGSPSLSGDAQGAAMLDKESVLGMRDRSNLSGRDLMANAAGARRSPSGRRSRGGGLLDCGPCKLEDALDDLGT